MFQFLEYKKPSNQPIETFSVYFHLPTISCGGETQFTPEKLVFVQLKSRKFLNKIITWKKGKEKAYDDMILYIICTYLLHTLPILLTTKLNLYPQFSLLF